MKKKNNFKYAAALIIRAFKLLYKRSPQMIIWRMIMGITQAVIPYFTLYMSAVLVNELIYSRNINKLIMYAAITVVGHFVLNTIKTLVYSKSFLYNDLDWVNETFFYLDHQNKLEYAHLENPEIALLFNKIQSAQNATGSGIKNLIWSIDLVMSGLTDIVCSAALSFSLFFTVVAGEHKGFFAFINSPLAIVIIIVIITANAFIVAHTKKATRFQTNKEWEAYADNNVFLDSYKNLWNTPDVPIFNMRKIILGELGERTLNPKWVINSEKIQVKYSSIRHISDTVMKIALTTFIAAKAYLGAFPIGNFLIYRRSVNKFIDGISGIAGELADLMHNNKTLELIYEYLDLPDDMYHGTLSVEKRSDNRYEIEFKNVSFKYPNTDTYVLKNVNLKFTIGDKLAIVGMNGSGKTTFIKLLCRLYDPTEGEILLNGINIKKYHYNEYLNIFSVVFQDFKTFSFSIAENVACTHNFDRDKVMQCLEKAGLGERIRSLEKGIDTYLNRDYERDGIDISGGEAQKLALARALYKNSPFIILDEPTASLDPIAEAEVYARFNDIVEDKTTLYISHRLSSCRFCKNILVFHEGGIIQHGSHEELIANITGKYYELWNAQAKYYQ